MQVHVTCVIPIPVKKDPDCLSQTAVILPGVSSESVHIVSEKDTKFPTLFARENSETSAGHVATGGVFGAVNKQRRESI